MANRADMIMTISGTGADNLYEELDKYREMFDWFECKYCSSRLCVVSCSYMSNSIRDIEQFLSILSKKSPEALIVVNWDDFLIGGHIVQFFNGEAVGMEKIKCNRMIAEDSLLLP